MHIGHLRQIDNKEILAKYKTIPEDIRKKIDDRNIDIKYPSLEEIEDETKRLEPLAMETIMEEHPKDVREFASGLDSIDAYVLGQHIGGLLKVGYHETGQDKRKVKIF